MEKKYRSALVVEGGALRGIHTAGVLDVFMRCNIYFPYVIGVSAGALNAYNYISHQIGRSADILLHYIRDDRYLNLRNIASRKESAFGFDFMFYGLQEYLPFDHETFNDPAQAFTVVATVSPPGFARRTRSVTVLFSQLGSATADEMWSRPGVRSSQTSPRQISPWSPMAGLPFQSPT